MRKIEFNISCMEMEHRYEASIHLYVLAERLDVINLKIIAYNPQVPSLKAWTPTVLELDSSDIQVIIDVLNNEVTIDSFIISNNNVFYRISPGYLPDYIFEDDNEMKKKEYDFQLTIERIRSLDDESFETIEDYYLKSSDLLDRLNYILQLMELNLDNE